MTTDHKKPAAGFWITVALVAVLVGYPLSAGPVTWMAAHEAIPDWSNAPLSWVTHDFRTT
jgi:hypothetical protein